MPSIPLGYTERTLMSGEIEHHPYRVVQQLRGTDPLARQLPRQVRRAVDREAAWGLTTAARAQAVGFVAEARVDAAELVTERTMLGLERLHRIEAAMAKADPIRGERFASLVDDFLLITRTDLRRLQREF
jgi:hypothetical protein